MGRWAEGTVAQIATSSLRTPRNDGSLILMI